MCVFMATHQHGVAISQLFLWYWLNQVGRLIIMTSGEQVALAFKLASAIKPIKERQSLFGKKQWRMNWLNTRSSFFGARKMRLTFTILLSKEGIMCQEIQGYIWCAEHQVYHQHNYTFYQNEKAIGKTSEFDVIEMIGMPLLVY